MGRLILEDILEDAVDAVFTDPEDETEGDGLLRLVQERARLDLDVQTTPPLIEDTEEDVAAFFFFATVEVLLLLGEMEAADLWTTGGAYNMS